MFLCPTKFSYVYWQVFGYVRKIFLVCPEKILGMFRKNFFGLSRQNFLVTCIMLSLPVRAKYTVPPPPQIRLVPYAAPMVSCYET
jgi:hypothetical protein